MPLDLAAARRSGPHGGRHLRGAERRGRASRRPCPRWPRRPPAEMLPNLGRLLPAARAAGVQVVHCTAYRRADGKGANTNARLFMGVRKSPVQLLPGTAEVEVRARARPRAGGPRAHPHPRPRTRWPAPTSTPCCATSASRTIVVTGVSVNVAITNLVMDAVNLGYDVVLPRDAVCGIPQEYADAVIDNTLALLATVTTTDDLARDLEAADAWPTMETGIRGDLEWGTDPARWPARRPSASATPRPSSTATSGSSFAELAAAADRAGRAFLAAGHRAGRPGGDLVAEHARVDRRRCSACSRPAASSCRSTPATRAPRRPTSSQAAGPASSSPSTASSATTTSPCSRATTCPHLEHTRRAARRRARRAPTPWATSSPRGDARAARPSSTRRVAAARARRRVRHPLHLGHHREPEGRRVHPRPDAARLRRLGRHRRPAPGRPLPRRQPVLPRLRLQGRHRRLPHRRRHARARRPCSTSRTAMANVAEHAHHRRCPGRRRSTRRSSTTPTSTCDSCSRCGSPSPAPPPSRWS